MEIADDDVRIKEFDSISPTNSVDKLKYTVGLSPSKKIDETKKLKINSKNKKSKTILRSQSVTNPKADNVKADDDDYSYHYSSTSATKLGSFSTMTEDDLENWKRKSAHNQILTLASPVEGQEPPLLTIASTLKDNSNITIGFNYDDKAN